MGTESPTTEPMYTVTLEDGDSAASDGRWVDAVAIWVRLRDGSLRQEADERLRWLLDETAPPEPRDPTPGLSPWSIILGAAALGFIGTAIVLAAERTTGTQAVVASLAAWACYLASGILILAYAFTLYHRDRPAPHITDADIVAASQIAERLDHHTQPHFSRHD